MTGEMSMFTPISDSEIQWACRVMRLPTYAFAGADGLDPRLQVMRSLDTLDVEACPGSGKTTLLVAKLAILANRWTSRQEGICVLSHTNAARAEIGDRLRSTSAGQVLLRPPHFIGTIHSFVNEFLAIPWLRSRGAVIKLIDTEAALNDRWWRLPLNTRRYLERQHQGPGDLSYTAVDFSGGGKMSHRPGTDTHQHMLAACRESTLAGYYCYDEMFVWAGEMLDRRPEVCETIRARFPLLFIDEVQDNSELQSAFIHRLFMEGAESVIRQRFGDSNQAIYNRTGAEGATTDRFPGPVKVDLPNSFRFGPSIAGHAAPLGVRPQALMGLGPTRGRVSHAEQPNVLFLFDDASILGVLPAYGQYLVDTFSPDALSRGEFTAVSGVHKPGDGTRTPRSMVHYAPDYDPTICGSQPKPSSLAQHLARGRLELASSSNTHMLVNACAVAILELARLGGGEVPSPSRNGGHRQLLELLGQGAARQKYQDLIERMITSKGDISEDDWDVVVASPARSVAEAVVGQRVVGAEAAKFLLRNTAAAVGALIQPQRSNNLFLFPAAAPQVSIRLGSIHSVKGETHTATLVLDSFRQAHHLKTLLPWISGTKPKAGRDNTRETSATQERLKLHYVAMTRPSHLLCLAMRSDALKAADLVRIQDLGWAVKHCT